MTHNLVIPVVLEGILWNEQGVAFLLHMSGEHRYALIYVDYIPSVCKFILCDLRLITSEEM